MLYYFANCSRRQKYTPLPPLRHPKVCSPAATPLSPARCLTHRQGVVPPVVLALQELEAAAVADLVGGGRSAEGPGAQVDHHDQQHWCQPLQQLLVRQLNLVR